MVVTDPYARPDHRFVPFYLWWADYGLWIPGSLTILLAIIGVLLLLNIILNHPVNRRPGIANDNLDSTNFERELRRRLKDLR
jgi:hypothetical protein